jgi:cysteinyl-tRNA synthetase
MKRKATEVEASESKNESSNSNVTKKIKIKASELASMDPQVQRIIKARMLVKKRDAARDEGDFDKADEIRSKLVALGVETIDQKGGPSVSSFRT